MNGEVTVTGRFSDFHAFIRALRSFHEQGYDKQLVAFSPIPRHEIEDAIPAGPSGVRYFTLAGSIIGFLAGAALTILTSLRMDIITGGKPIISIPPFIIIMFELTILFGGLATFVGFLFNGRLPSLSKRIGYVEDFSRDVFGISLACTRKESDTLSGNMKQHGAVEVVIE